MSTESIFEIQHLIYMYAELIDSGDFSGIGELFQYGCVKTEDPENPGAQGKEEVEKLYRNSARLYPDGTPQTKHLVNNLMVDVQPDDKTATARSYYTVLQKTDTLPLQPIITGRYRDSFQRVEQDNNSWHFAERIMIVDHIGDLSQHLLFEL